jgi:hypothetical protein
VEPEELITGLKALQNGPVGDFEVNHILADKLLLQYINDPEVYRQFMRIRRWYA